MRFDPDDAKVRALVREILDRREYAAWHAKTSPVHWFRWLESLHIDNPPLFYLLCGALTLLLILIVGHVVWTIRRSLVASPPDGRAAAPHPARSFVDDAAALAEQGRFLDASRAVQLGAIQLLVAAGRIRLGRGDPNRVLRRRLDEARIGDGLRAELVASIATLERRWFRDREEDESLYRRWRRVYGELATEVTGA